MSPIARRPLGCLVAIALLTALVVARPAHAGERRVGIVVSLRVNVDAAKAQELAAKLGQTIADDFAVEVVAGADAEALLTDEVSETCFDEPACVRAVGKQLRVDEILFVALVALSVDAVQIEITAVNVTTAKGASRPMVEVNPNDPDQALSEHARKLMPDARRRPKPAPAPPEPAPLPPPPRVEKIKPSPADGRSIGTGTWIAAGATVASLAAGTTFAVISRMEYNDLKNTCPNVCDKDSLRLKNTLADSFFAASIVGAALTTYLYLRSGEDPPATHVSVAGQDEQIGVSFGGVF